MNLQRTLILFAVLAASSAAARPAHAQCAGGYGFGPYGYWDIGRLYSVLADEVPYHAAFPPVYYSHPVPRTYGYSPFAYPPGVMTPEVEAPAPEVIENPYVQPEAEEVEPQPAPADETTAIKREPQPLVIMNPYVTDAKLAAAE
ncbi:MAG TPA: hypothetical protein VF175_05900 [Lacipirellula sp.]